MKLGSLFDGIGTFPLSGLQHGIIPVWASEIEAFPIKVTKQHHFPNMKHLGDITKINGAEIEPVDVITFGSPCQDMSVAGKREGLCGARSGLFMEAVRIIREMRGATGGKYPRFCVWENVPGAYSSNGGQDFRAVLEEIAEAEIPMSESGKWAEAGMVRTSELTLLGELSMPSIGVSPKDVRESFLSQILEANVPEKYFCRACLGILRRAEKRGEEAAGDVGDGIKTTGDVCGCLSCGAHPGGLNGQDAYNHQLIIEPSSTTYVIQNATRGKSQNGLDISQDDVSYTLDSLGNHAVCIQGSMIGRADKNGPQGDGINEEVSFTLNTIDRHAVAYPDPANTLLAKANLSFRGDQDTLVAGLDCRNGKENGDLCGTLQAKANGGFSYNCTSCSHRLRRPPPYSA